MPRPSSQRPELMLVLDLDGVVTDPHTNQVSNAMLDAIATDLKRGVPVAFNTGRSLEWIQERVLPGLFERCSAVELKGLMVAAEKGGVLGFAEAGKLRRKIDRSLLPPQDFRDAAKTLLDEPVDGGKLGDAIMWDGTKETMISFERRPDISMEAYQEARLVLDDKLKAMMTEHAGMADYIMDSVIISTDIEHNTAGKDAGADAILKWLAGEGIKPRSFVAIGDAPSDAVMASALSFAAPTKFVYVGDPRVFSPLDGAPYEVIITGGGYSQAAAAFLAEINQHT